MDSVRYGFTGFHEAPVALSLAVRAAVAGAVFGIAMALGRGWRLKP